MSKAKKSRIRKGRCKLTHCDGQFVDSHILPKALTKADGLDPGLIQMGNGQTERRFSSWYDQFLVTQEGENILANYDNWAIPVLRKYQLVWSGWGPLQELTDVNIFSGVSGIRILKGGNWKKLRMFFLSLLWRAATTNRPEFSEIEISVQDLEQLRKMVLAEDPFPLDFYPISLTQHSTRGINHNLTPLADVKKIPNLDPAGGEWEMPYFRFYLDGLILHISRLPPERNRELDLGPIWVGSHLDDLCVTTVPWIGSSQQLNLELVIAETKLGRPLWELETGPFAPPVRRDKASP